MRIDYMCFLFVYISHSIKPIEVVYEEDNTTKISPQLEPSKSRAEIDYISSYTGLEDEDEEICRLWDYMSLDGKINSEDSNDVIIQVLITRWNTLYACHIMEYVAVSYGYDNLPKKMPNINTFTSASLLNNLSDHVRKELAMAGFTEVAPSILCSYDENFMFLNPTDDSKTAIY